MDRGQRTVAILALGCFLLVGVSTFIDFDCWHQMALARETLALGHVPLADQFAYTPTVYPVIHRDSRAAVHDAVRCAAPHRARAGSRRTAAVDRMVAAAPRALAEFARRIRRRIGIDGRTYRRASSSSGARGAPHRHAARDGGT